MDLTALLESNSLTDKFYDLQAWQFEGSVYGLPLEGIAEPVFTTKGCSRSWASLYRRMKHSWKGFEEDARRRSDPSQSGTGALAGRHVLSIFLQNYAGDRELNADWRQGRHCFDDFVQALRDFEHFLALQPFRRGRGMDDG